MRKGRDKLERQCGVRGEEVGVEGLGGAVLVELDMLPVAL